MNLKLKYDIRNAIEKVIEKEASVEAWAEYLHPQLVDQMTNAAEAVFDAAQNAQTYLKHETQDGRPG